MISWPFTWSTQITEPPTASAIRFNVAPPYVGTLTKLWIPIHDTAGLDITRGLLYHGAGTTVYLQDRNDHLIGVLCVINGAHIEKGEYIEIPVQCTAESGALNNNQAVEVFFLPFAPTGTATGPVGRSDPLLVTFDEAKRHLRVLDDDHDQDIDAKLLEASATIRDYLAERNDPTWSSATAPPWVQAAVKLYLGHLYEHRGDEFGADNDAIVWAAIAALCRRSQDAAFA